MSVKVVSLPFFMKIESIKWIIIIDTEVYNRIKLEQVLDYYLLNPIQIDNIQSVCVEIRVRVVLTCLLYLANRRSILFNHIHAVYLSQGGARDTRPLGVQFFYFHAVFRKKRPNDNFLRRTPCEILGPPLWAIKFETEWYFPSQDI